MKNRTSRWMKHIMNHKTYTINSTQSMDRIKYINLRHKIIMEIPMEIITEIMGIINIMATIVAINPIQYNIKINTNNAINTNHHPIDRIMIVFHETIPMIDGKRNRNRNGERKMLQVHRMIIFRENGVNMINNGMNHDLKNALNDLSNELNNRLSTRLSTEMNKEMNNVLNHVFLLNNNNNLLSIRDRKRKRKSLLNELSSHIFKWGNVRNFHINIRCDISI